MERTLIADLRGKLDQTVKVQGMLQTLRDQKKMQFIVLRDHCACRWPTGRLETPSWPSRSPRSPREAC